MKQENVKPVCNDGDVICFCAWVTKRNLLEHMPHVRNKDELRIKTGSTRTCMGCELDFDYIVDKNIHLLGQNLPVLESASYRSNLLNYRMPTPTIQRQVSWIVGRENLSSRLVMGNVKIPTLENDTWEMLFKMTLFDSDGQVVFEDDSFVVEKNKTWSFEFKPLIEKLRIGMPYHGLVQIDGLQPCLGGTRFSVQWYNRRGVTSSHERFDNAIYRAREYQRYFANPAVVVNEKKDTYYVISNLHLRPYSTAIVLQNHKKEQQKRNITVLPNGSVFRSIEETFDDVSEFLGGRLGVFYYENRTVCAAHYHLTYDKQMDVWQAQHT